MYDFWYTMGVATIKPALLDPIKSAAAFDFYPRIVIDVINGVNVTRQPGPSTGLLEEAPTEAVRLAIAKFVKAYSPSAPPIGVYTAGRMCQLVLIDHFSNASPKDTAFKNIIALAHSGYTGAVGAGPESKLPSFPAFLGLCLLDANMVLDFAAPTPKLAQIVSEFGIKIDAGNREWQIATAFVQTQGFKKATFLLMAADNDPWQGGGSTLEQAYFWSGKTEYAIP